MQVHFKNVIFLSLQSTFPWEQKKFNFEKFVKQQISYRKFLIGNFIYQAHRSISKKKI